MSDTFETIDDPKAKPRHKGGIKSYTFTASGTNGTSHRAHREVKHKRYLNNRQIRADLYSSMQGEKANHYAKEWHQRIDSLSRGVS